jgi:hypothetical protein
LLKGRLRSFIAYRRQANDAPQDDSTLNILRTWGAALLHPREEVMREGP